MTSWVAMLAVVAAFDTAGKIVTEPKIAANNNSFFITSPFFAFSREQQRLSNQRAEFRAVLI
jgi:hypothetical protein